MELEERIADLVASVLGKDRDEIDSAFPGGLVELGYSSLQALQLNRILEDEFDREVNILDVVDARGISDICALVASGAPGRSGSDAEVV